MPSMILWSLWKNRSTKLCEATNTYCFIPTCRRLIMKGIHCEDTCVIFYVMVESHIHIFFVCLKALDCWTLVQLDNIV